MANNIEEIIFNKYIQSGDIQEYGKKLGPKVRIVKYRNKNFAGKLIEKELSKNEIMIENLIGTNIIKIHKICKPKEINGNKYCLIIMDKATLRDLEKFNNFYHNYNLLRLIIPIGEKFNDNISRLFMRQIVFGLEILERNNYMNYNIKPENILISPNLITKLSLFSDINRMNTNASLINTSKKTLDYFGLGCTLFFLKFGKDLQNIIKFKNITIDQIVKIIFQYINNINNNKTIDRDLIYFLFLLIKGGSNESLTFEEVYRNKWLNNNLECLDNITLNFESDEEKFIPELTKNDFIIKKSKLIDYNAERINKNLIKNNRENVHNFKRKKFIFKKALKYNLCIN